MHFADTQLTFISHGINFTLFHETGRKASPGKTLYYLSHNTRSNYCDNVRLRAIKQLVRKYCGSDCKISSESNSAYGIYKLEIDIGTTKEQRAAFLGALAARAEYI